jgi:hypothetical protein
MGASKTYRLVGFIIHIAAGNNKKTSEVAAALNWAQFLKRRLPKSCACLSIDTSGHWRYYINYDQLPGAPGSPPLA